MSIFTFAIAKSSIRRIAINPAKRKILSPRVMPVKFYLIKHPEFNSERNKMFDDITSRFASLTFGLNTDYINLSAVATKVVSGMTPSMKPSEVDNLAAEICATMTTKHRDYACLAARIAINRLYEETKEKFSSVIEDLHSVTHSVTGKPTPLISDDVYKIVMENAERLDSAIDHTKDFSYNYFGFKTLEKSYLLKINDKIVERPQHMLMRVAVGIHMDDIDAALETYRLMSEKWFTHASPTLFNAGTPRPQMSSCFLLTMEGDSLEGIYDTLKRCALISKYAGGIGLNVHSIRAKGSYIDGTNGTSSGLIPMLRVFNNTARHVGQGGDKRPAAFAVYLEPWHADVLDFLDLKKNTGKEELRARDLFYALWVPDLFMRRVQEDGIWSLMCPHESPGLQDCWGEEFDQLYERYEKEGSYKRQVKAQEIWYAIVESQIETGTPYMVYKDACNRKSNQCHLGTIKCSNLCTEVVQFSSPEEVAVCNLASLSLPRFVQDEKFDLMRLGDMTRVVCRNLNRVIDRTFYPVEEARRSNLRHRPLGIGVQGLADAFLKMALPFDGEEARRLNVDIFETIYYAALDASCELAEKEGPYETFGESPASQGVLQYDMWNVKPSGLWNWTALKERIAKYGLRNSLLVAPMPTASTAQILGNNESIEPYTTNIYSRRVLSGEFQVVNQYLMKDLISMGVWNENMKNRLLASHGSVQDIDEIPNNLKRLYRTVWEIPQKHILEMAADRGPYIDQSQSLNVHIAEPNYGKITSMHFYGWKLGLKTGMYYLRSKPAVNAIQFTVDKTALKEKSVQNDSLTKQDLEAHLAKLRCTLPGNKDTCISCSG